MAKDTPLQTMKKIYGTKDKLVDSVVDAVKHEGESKEEAVARLKSVSNGKLLRMSAVAKAVADRGGREKVIAAVGNAIGRTKDSDYLGKIGLLSSTRLMELLRSAEKHVSKRS